MDPEGGPQRLAPTTAALTTALSQFYAALGCDPQTGDRPADPATGAPFLSVIVRTRGRRSLGLAQALAALDEQEDSDFEVLLMAHQTDAAGARVIEDAVSQAGEAVRGRLRRIEVRRDGRAAPLNDGFAAARGRYIAVLDDDDVAYPNWVAAFRRGSEQAQGRIVRTVAQSQAFRLGDRGGAPFAEPTGPLETWLRTFDLLEHVYANHTPFLAVAFPRAVFHEWGLRFDESLNTAEDWDFLLRSALLVGVESVSDVTALYRLWDQYGASREEHTDDEWDGDFERIRCRFDNAPLVLPVGSSQQIRNLIEMRDDLRRDVASAVAGQEEAHRATAVAEAEIARLRADSAERSRLLEEVLGIRASWAWRLTGPLRGAMRLASRGAPAPLAAYSRLETGELRKEVAALHESRSMRLVRRLRRALGGRTTTPD